MRRSISVVVAYLVLVVAAFLGEFVLVTGFVGYTRGAARGMLSLVELAGQGPVRGVYAVAPYYYEVRPGEVRVGTGLHISLLNPNPLGTEVVLLGIYSLSGRNESQIVDLFRYGSPAEVDARGASFKAGAPSWWRQEGFTLVRYIAMEPHGFLSFVLVSRLPAPKEVLACTPVGCTRLEHLGPSYAPTTLLEGGATWIILGNTTGGSTGEAGNVVRVSKIGVQQIWQWDAYTYAWEEAECYTLGPYITPERCTPAVLCCRNCPAACIPWSYGDRGRCEIASGSMIAFSNAVGLPSNVIAGYYSEDSKWGFTVSGTYWPTATAFYRLTGASFRGTEHLDLMPVEWDDYSYDECNTRYVTITIDYRILDEHGNPRQFKDIWPNSDTIHWYAALKTYQSSGLIHSIVDEAWLTLCTVETPGGRLGECYTVHSAGTQVEDGAALLKYSPEDWFLLSPDDYGVRVTVVYKMQLAQRGLPCGKSGLGGISCGDEEDHTVRLGFYLELIPDEAFASSPAS